MYTISVGQKQTNKKGKLFFDNQMFISKLSNIWNVALICDGLHVALEACWWKTRTSVGFRVHIFIDGVMEILLLVSQLPGSQHITHTLVEVSILALWGAKAKHRDENSATPNPRTVTLAPSAPPVTNSCHSVKLTLFDRHCSVKLLSDLLFKTTMAHLRQCLTC